MMKITDAPFPIHTDLSPKLKMGLHDKAAVGQLSKQGTNHSLIKRTTPYMQTSVSNVLSLPLFLLLYLKLFAHKLRLGLSLSYNSAGI